MPIYEYRCQLCRNTSSFYLRTFSAATPSNCQHCDSPEIHRILSSFAYVKSEATKLSQLDPKYHKMVDAEEYVGSKLVACGVIRETVLLGKVKGVEGMAQVGAAVILGVLD